MSEQSLWTVLKFGGTSVSSRAHWEKISQRVGELLSKGERPLVVCSALSGISDLLDELGQSATYTEFGRPLAEIERRHRELATALDISAEEVVGDELAQVARLAKGISLVGEVSPPVKARLMALGELMSTRMGAAFLEAQGIDVAWQDARQMLSAKARANAPRDWQFLSASCPFESDRSLRQRLDKQQATALITQGFIAADEQGRTVLLGRGGSDTSAAYLAAKIEAQRLEIWTDVPGIFTANPRQIEAARLLRTLDYDEAQELATMGAKVLHPRCIPPVRQANIDLVLRCTPHPEFDHTVISAGGGEQGAQVKAISAKKGVTAVSMDTLGMWQEVGFLADIFAIFKAHGLSVDLVATSEANVTVTLDPTANALEPQVLARLDADLNEVCRAQIVDSCAVVSLVGRKIRSLLADLAPALRVFGEHQIHLVSQAASDLNLSLVVDEEQADRLVQKLHGMLFGEKEPDAVFGPRWSELVGPAPDDVFEDVWWRKQADRLCALATEKGPVYAYDESTARGQAQALCAMKSIDRLYFAIKANPHRQIMAMLADEGLGFECVSPPELERAAEVLADRKISKKGRLLFTPNFASRQEYVAGFKAGATVTLDNLYPLEHWPQVFAGQEVMVRVDPGHGKGHHRYVRTAGPRSKFGVSVDELSRLAELAAAVDLRVVGLHAHVGSGVREAGTWSQTAVFLESCREYFPDVSILNLGGGLGVPERSRHEPLDLKAVDQALADFKEAHPDLEVWLEPGRFLVSEAGVLLAPVTQLKQKGALHYVGVSTGMNSLIRPALYGAHHRIVNLSRIDDEPDGFYEVVGPICESGDVLGHARQLAAPQEGDILLIANAGAYGRAMSSHYNLRAPASEVFIAQD